jgi:hypothetical protein
VDYGWIVDRKQFCPVNNDAVKGWMDTAAEACSKVHLS